MSRCRICLVFLWCCACLSARAAWYDGAFYVPDLPEEMELQNLRQGGEADSGQYRSGLIRLGSSTRNDVFLVGSNRLACYYTTPGELTVERFEQLGDASEEGLQKSRLILHITEGVLTVDSSALSASSQCIVETPLGRLTAGAGVWTVSVSYDVRTRIYNFTMESIDVELSFKTHPGDRFVIQAGQMLTGAGASTLPDLEIADLLNSAQDRVGELGRLMEASDAELSNAALNAKLRPIANRSTGDAVESIVVESSGGLEAKRPIVIEYSPRPNPLVPFRGVVRPPSEYQKDLF